jgi:drug/metabolite transporter (DMT)-like permease
MRQALLATIGFSAFYGLQIVLSKMFLKDAIHPLHLNFLTCLMSFIILSIYFWIFDKKHLSLKIDKKMSGLFLLVTILWIAADMLALTGLKISSSINYSILSRLGVIVTYVLAVLFFKEVFKLNKTIAVILSFIGAITVVYNFRSKVSINVGDLLFLASTASNSISGLFRQRVTKHVSSFQLTYMMFGLGALVLGIITFIFLPLNTIPVPWFILANSVLALIGFNFVNYAIAKGGASFFSVASSLLPVATAIFSFFILKQLPLVNQIIGGFIIVFSIFLFQKKHENR